MTHRLRVGRHVGRTIYLMVGPEPSDDDRLIGVMDTPYLAERAVEAVNRLDDLRERVKSLRDQAAGNVITEDRSPRSYGARVAFDNVLALLDGGAP